VGVNVLNAYSLGWWLDSMGPGLSKDRLEVGSGAFNGTSWSIIKNLV